MSFESVNWPGYFIRHTNYWLKIERGSTNLFENDASFKICKGDAIFILKTSNRELVI